MLDGATALQGGPLYNECYQLAQFHFHWGAMNRRGAEHKVDGVTYAGEVPDQTRDIALGTCTCTCVLETLLYEADNFH